MVQKRVEINGCEFVELITESGVSHICQLANVGKSEYYLYGDKGEGFSVGVLDSEDLLELITTNEVNISGGIVKPFEEETVKKPDKDPLYIAFVCDEWRGHSSFGLIGAFDKAGLMKYFASNYKNFRFNGAELILEDLESIFIEDMLENRVEHLHVVKTDINEILI